MPRASDQKTIGGTVVTTEQQQAWNEMLEKSGLKYSDAMREAMRLLCEAHGVDWPSTKIVHGVRSE